MFKSVVERLVKKNKYLSKNTAGWAYYKYCCFYSAASLQHSDVLWMSDWQPVYFPGLCVSLSIINLPHNNLFFTDKKRYCVSAVPAYSGLNMEVDFSLKRLKRKLPYFVSIYRVRGSWSNFPQGLSPGRNANDNKLSLASGRCGMVILTTYSHVYVHRYGFQRRQHKTKHAYTHIWN